MTWGHRVMRGLNATNAMSQGLIKTSSALHPRSGHAHVHLSDSGGSLASGWVDGEASVCGSVYDTQTVHLFVHRRCSSEWSPGHTILHNK